MPVMRKRKDRKREREKGKGKKKKAQGCLQAFDQTGPDQTGR